MQISTAIDIASTPEAVFGWLGHPEKAMAWMTTVSQTEILNETPDIVGTTFRETLKDGGTVEMQGVVTSYVPNKCVAFHLDSKLNTLDVEYTIEETRTGVRLVEHANVHWKFPVNIISLFAGNKLKQGITTQLQSEFNKLKELCEGGAAAASK